MGKRTVQDAIADDIQKRRYPTKYYVYVIHVTWSDGSVNVVYRRYSQFFDLQMKLLSLFPDEAGGRNPTQRIIPFLPGKKLFGRSQTREVASKRLVQLNEYCKSLVRLPTKVSECEEVLQFFTPSQEDINPQCESPSSKKSANGSEIDVISDPIQPDPYIVIADYKKQQKNEIDLHAGDSVEVFEKNDNGWWFISASDNQGWAPATFLTRADGVEDDESISGTEEHYITNNSYQATQEDELSFETGVVVTVKQKSLDGWWTVSYQDKMGWVPAAFLQVYTGPVDVVASSPVQHIGNVMNVSDIMSRRQGADAAKNSPLAGRRGDLQGHGTERKPTPPRRNTVRPRKPARVEKTVRKNATRKGRPSAPKPKLEYYTVSDFADDAGDSISFKSGQKVQVVQETDSGWWLVKIGDREGWAPSSFIESRSQVAAEARPKHHSMDSLDEETGESTNRPPRPPPPSAATAAAAAAVVATTAAATRQPNAAAARPVPTPPGDRSAFRPVSGVHADNKGQRPLPVTPAVKPVPGPVSSPSAAQVLQSAQAKLRPVKAVGRPGPPPLVNRGNKPNLAGLPPVLAPRSTDDDDGGSIAGARKQLKSVSLDSGPPKPKPPRQAKPANSYVTTGDYQNSDEEGLSFQEGMNVEVLEEDDSGWWLVRIRDKEGWAPSTYLEKC